MKKGLFKKFVTSFIVIVLVNLISFILIESKLKLNVLNLLYLSTILFIIFYLIFFPTILYILKNSTSIKNVENVFLSINESNIDSFYQSIEKNQTASEYIEQHEKNPFNIIKDQCLQSIENKDHSIPKLIVFEMETWLIKNMDNSISDEKNSKRLGIYITVIESISNRIIDKKEKQLYEYLFDSLSNCYFFIAKMKFDLKLIEQYNQLYKQCILNIVRNEHDTYFHKFNNLINNILSLILKNYTPEEK